MMSKPFSFAVLFIFLFIFPLLQTGWAKSPLPDLNKKRYMQATALAHNLSFNRGEKNRERWLQCIKIFQKGYHQAPGQKTAPLSLYKLAAIYGEMHERFGDTHFLNESIGYYEDLTLLFPQHRLADDALLILGKLSLEKKNDRSRAEKLFARIIAIYPKGDMAEKAADLLRQINGTPNKSTSLSIKSTPLKIMEKKQDPVRMAHLSEPIRFWSTKNYTRIVIEASHPVRFKESFLPAAGNLPKRLYVDLFNCRIAPTFQNLIPIQDGLLKRVRGAQFNRDTVRIVLDTQSVDNHKIFTLENPFRVVIDVTANKPRRQQRLPTLAEQFGLGVQTIVIDPGHGGKDPGALGANGLQEKDVVLKVAKKVAAILEKETAYKVILTRKDDSYLRLEERTAIANTKEADLFVSIHANSAPNRKARGVETYFLSLATSREEMRAAARENASSQSQLSDLQTILKDLMQNSKIEESSKLAGSIQGQLVSGLSVNNLGVKKAPFIVLIGAQMPAILTEIAFLSNKEEERLLRDERYLNAISRNIVNGVKHYVSNLNTGI